MKISRQNLANFLTYLCLFLLPWQTVWIYDSVGDGEYQKLLLYAVQFLIILTALVRGKIQVPESTKEFIKNSWFLYLAILISVFFSVNVFLSLAFSFHLLFALLLFCLLLDERIKIEKIIWFFTLGLIIPCGLGWWQVLSGASPASTLLGLAEHLAITPGTAVVEVDSDRIMRAYGSFPHPNIFGGYLVMAILMVLGKSKRLSALMPKKIIPLVIIFILSSTLVITFSRSAWLALITGVIGTFIFHIVRRKKISRNFLLGLAVVLISCVATTALFRDAIFARIVPIERLEVKSLSERQSEYQMIGEVIKINPFVGVGPGAYTLALEKLNPGQPIWSYQPMHNSFLLFFAETGLLGLVFVILSATRRISPRDLDSVTPSLLLSITTIAMLDHYLWSQWAGLALSVVVFTVVLKKK